MPHALPSRLVVLAFLVTTVAGCGTEPPAPDPAAGPVMVERSHSHRHVHGPGIDHGHTHPDFPAGAHDHEHAGH